MILTNELTNRCTELASDQETVVSLPDLSLCVCLLIWRKQYGSKLDSDFRGHGRQHHQYERRIRPELSPPGILQHNLDPIGHEVWSQDHLYSESAGSLCR